MTEPIREVMKRSYRSSGRGTLRTAEPLDVLLIADEPRMPGNGRGKRSNQRGTTSRQPESAEPLDMESVVRRLIALLSEETQP